MLSPNFGINNKFASLISWPFSEYWLKLILGKTIKHKPRNNLNKKYWTMSYPTIALIPMAKLVNEVNDKDYSKVDKPALFYFSMDDKVVDPKKIKNQLKEIEIVIDTFKTKNLPTDLVANAIKDRL